VTSEVSTVEKSHVVIIWPMTTCIPSL